MKVKRRQADNSPVELPLAINGLGEYGKRVIHLRHDGSSVAVCDNPEAAAYIVAAVNAYPLQGELVEALEAMLPDYLRLSMPEYDPIVRRRRQAIIGQARAGLAKVKGE